MVFIGYSVVHMKNVRLGNNQILIARCLKCRQVKYKDVNSCELLPLPLTSHMELVQHTSLVRMEKKEGYYVLTKTIQKIVSSK